MIFHPVNARSGEEGRAEWLRLRLGIPTASCFDKIITPKKLELSSQHQAYMMGLLEEWITGEQIAAPQSEWMQRGIEDEDLAISSYESIYDVETEPGGFATTDDGMIGASADRLANGRKRAVEIKTGAIRTMAGYALNGGLAEDHLLQVQGQIMIYELDDVEVFGYNRIIIPKPVRVTRDDKTISCMRSVLGVFVDKMLEARLKLEREYGPFTRIDRAPAPADHSQDFLAAEDEEAIVRARFPEASGVDPAKDKE